MAGSETCTDIISELPDFILHQILSLLPAKVAAKTSVISKRWRHIWDTFPILDCCQLFFGKYLDMINPKEIGLTKDVRRNIFDQRVKFMRYIDEKLRRISENDRCIKKFRLVMTLVSVVMFPRVDVWMDLVIGLGAQELELCLTLGRGRFYTLPIRVLASQSLTILRLKGCILMDCLSKDDLQLSSLVELHLHGSFIDEESILNLISSANSLEVLSLKACLGFTKLNIHGHRKLKKVVYHSHKDLKLKNFSINLPILEELIFVRCYRPKKVLSITDHLVSPNLKNLSLSCVLVGRKSLSDFVSSFPLLGHLVLVECTVIETAYLSSPLLQEIYLRHCSYTEKVVLDTPRLQVLKYCGVNMDDLPISNIAGDRIAEVVVPLRDIDWSWFTKLKNFLRKNIFQELILSITASPERGNVIAFSTINFEQFSQPFELRSLKLVFLAFGSASVNCEACFDGLLWNLHPKTLQLELNYSSAICVKGLLKSLVEGAEPMCCHGENLQCWRHSLKGVKLGKVRGFQAGTLLDLCTLSSLNNFLDNWAVEAQGMLESYETLKEETLSFDLSW